MKNHTVRELPRNHPARSSFEQVLSGDYVVLLTEGGLRKWI